jgi:hypothetical protein
MSATVKAMLKPCDLDLMKAYEVSRVVNSVKDDTPGVRSRRLFVR